MPKYKNISQQPIFLDKDNKTIKPGETIETYSFYNNPDLELVDIKPYILPFDISEEGTVDSLNNKEYNIIDKSNILIVAVDGDLRIYFNEKADKNYILLKQGSSYEFKNTRNLVYKLILSPNSDSKPSKYYILITNYWNNQINF